MNLILVFVFQLVLGEIFNQFRNVGSGSRCRIKNFNILVGQ